MLKNLAFAFASMFVLSGSAFAGDLMDDLAKMDLNTINDTSADVEELDLDAIDLDGLTADAGEDTDAIEACFRRFGGFRRGGWGGHWGGGWGGYRCGFRSYGHCYNVCRPLYCYRPIVRCYHHCAPVITSYWGCY